MAPVALSMMFANSLRRLACCVVLCCFVSSGIAATGRGVLVRFTGQTESKSEDFGVLPNFELYVPADQAPSAFLNEGPFQSDWISEVRVPRRDHYQFTIETSGSVKLFVNEVLAAETDAKEVTSKALRLNRGYNAIRLNLTSPVKGDTFLRLRWESKGMYRSPLPERFLKYTTEDSAFSVSQHRLEGRSLFLEYRCGNCHSVEAGTDSLVNRPNDGPSFVGIGSRRQRGWLEKWILDPHSLREQATMPVLLHGENSMAEASAISAWLAQQKDSEELVGSFRNGDLEAGRQLVESLHCAGCHRIRDTEDSDEGLIGFDRVDSKFLDGILVSFLLNPSRHFDSIRMPHFGLSIVEAEDIAAFLVSQSLPSADQVSPDEALVNQGRSLVQSKGCLNCHQASVPNKHSAKPLRLIASDAWEKGCMNAKPKNNDLPRYSLSVEKRKALAVFGKSRAESSLRRIGHQDTSRELEKLNCQACHGAVETVPELTLLGEKLKPEWSASILDGTLNYKPRPWLEARMPSFGRRGKLIAEGMAMLNGLPPETESDTKIDSELAEIGRDLISANGGLACVTCHDVGPAPATAVFESAGINFAYANERLQRGFFHRWVMNPTLIDSESKMPVYFSDGESPLPDVLDDSADSQINAIWEYFKQGFDINPPD